MARVIDRLVGHRDILNPLFKAVEKEKLASTLLFTGASRIGKRLAALSLAQAAICERKILGACGECPSCLRVDKESSESLMIAAPEGSSIKIEQARDMLQFLTLRRLGRARFIIVEQAHLLNPQAANALLKSLEEPPEGSHYILITSAPAALLPTIRSRSQLVRFRPLLPDELTTVLNKFDVQTDDWLIETAQGSVEAALRLTESREDYQELENATLSYLTCSREQFPGAEISKLKDLTKDKTAQAFFGAMVQTVLRDALRIQSGLSVGASKKQQAWLNLSKSAAQADPRALSRLTDHALTLETDMSRNVDRSLVLENFALALRKV